MEADLTNLALCQDKKHTFLPGRSTTASSSRQCCQDSQRCLLWPENLSGECFPAVFEFLLCQRQFDTQTFRRKAHFTKRQEKNARIYEENPNICIMMGGVDKVSNSLHQVCRNFDTGFDK